MTIFKNFFKQVPAIPADVVWTLNGDETVIRASKNRGAAIYSIKLRGFEYVVSDINGNGIQNNWPVLGNLLQTAYQLDGQGERNNPTEAGSAEGVPSSVISAGVSGKVLTTAVHPAFFYRLPDGRTISNDTISKRVVVDYQGIANLVRHDVTIVFSQAYQRADITGIIYYVNAALNKLYALDGALMPIPFQSDPTYNPGKYIVRRKPLILASADGTKACGVYGPNTGYGMMAWAGDAGTANMFVMSGQRNNNDSYILIPCPAGAITFHGYYAMGTLAEVQQKLSEVARIDTTAVA
jgi:hypothetical protein